MLTEAAYLIDVEFDLSGLTVKLYTSGTKFEGFSLCEFSFFVIKVFICLKSRIQNVPIL